MHASQNENNALNLFMNESKNGFAYDLTTKKSTNGENKSVPDLYPIKSVKKRNYRDTEKVKLEDLFSEPEIYIKKCLERFNLNNQVVSEQDEFNPLNFCAVSIEEAKLNANDIHKKLEAKRIIKSGKKKYKCTICSKIFGWSTDLKRHLLIHSGIRPFKCQFCNATFTRNFLLQNHITKKHTNSTKKSELPNLKPILSNIQSLNNKYNLNKNETLVQ